MRRRSRHLWGAALLLLIAACSTEQHAAAGDPTQQLPATGGAVAGAQPPQAGAGGAAATPAPSASGSGGASGASGAGAAGGSAPAQPTAGAGATPAAGSGGQGTVADAGPGAADSGAADAAMVEEFSLMPVGLAMASAEEFAFPSAALPPTNESPEFTWTGVPEQAKSLALVFRDLSAGAVKWVIWDIPPAITGLPPAISAEANPSEVPGSSQLGSLGNQGYAGPCCTSNQYEFVLWALDVEMLPGTAGLSTVRIRDDVLPAHQIAVTEPILMRRIMP